MKNSSYLFLHRIFKGIADSTIKIFIPLLIYQATGNIVLSFVFCFVDYALTGVLFLCFRKFIQKFSILSIILHIFPIIIAEFVLLFNLNLWLIFALAILDAVSSTLYYGALNLIFGYLDSNANAAKFEAGQYVGLIIFSILSAYVLGELQNSIIFVVIASVFLYVVSIIPLCFKYKQLKQDLSNLPKTNFKTLFKDNLKFSLFHFFNGALVVISETVFPLYLYIKGIAFSSIGLLVALQYLVNILGGFLSRYLVSKNLTKWINVICIFLYVSSLIVIMLVNQMYVAYLFVLIFSISHQMMFVTMFNKFTIDQMKKNYFHDSIFYRDLYINSGRALMSVGYLLLPAFPFLFGMGIAMALGICGSGWFISTPEKEKEEKS